MPAPSLDGRVLRAVTGDGAVTADTELSYREKDDLVWARYQGGRVRHGHLVGRRTGDDLDARYAHALHDGTAASGRLTSTLHVDADGRLRLDEQWASHDPAEEGSRVLLEEAPLVHPGGVSLRPIVGEDGHRAVMRLELGPGQTNFVAPNAVSLAQGPWEEPPGWMRAVWFQERLVGFVMCADLRRAEERWYLWRLMIAASEQRAGYGRAVLELLCEHIRRHDPPHELAVSWVEGDGGPAPFYLAFGFEPTGEIDEDEVVARLVRWPERLSSS